LVTDSWLVISDGVGIEEGLLVVGLLSDELEGWLWGWAFLVLGCFVEGQLKLTLILNIVNEIRSVESKKY
jgi:hypothetical protein